MSRVYHTRSHGREVGTVHTVSPWSSRAHHDDRCLPSRDRSPSVPAPAL